MNKYKFKQSRTIISFLIVPILLIIIFAIIPIMLMIFYSFTDWDGFSQTFNFVGLENYYKFWQMDNLQPFKAIIVYLIAATFQLLIGGYLALYTYFHPKYQKILIIICVLPVFINTVAVGLIFILFFQPSGMFDQIIEIITFHHYQSGNILWIGNHDFVNKTLVLITVWRYTSFTFILTYSGLKSVNPNLIKAAYQAGANQIQIARYVLLPNIKITLNLIIIMLVIGALTTLEIPMIITKGALNTKTIIMRLNEVAFTMRDYGLASVISIMIIGIISILLYFCLKKGKKNEEY